MATETMTAAPQPAPPAQPSGETQKTGAANSTVSSFTQMLLKQEQAREAQATAAEKAPETPATETEKSATPATEETQVPTTEVQTEEAAPAEKAETKTEEKTDEALSHENKLDPKLQEIINKRIGKERVKTKAAEGQVAHLQAQIERLQKQIGAPAEEKPVMVPVPANTPLAQVPDLAALNEVQRQARADWRAAEELLDRDDIAQGVKVGDRIYSKADLKAIIRDARVTLEDLVPARQQFLTAQAEAKQKTLEQFPYLLDRTSTEYMEHQAALRANPWLMTQPNADWIVAVQLEGTRALAAKAEAAKKPAPEKKAAPKPKPAGDQTVVSSDGSSSRVSGAAQARAAVGNVLTGKRGVGAKDFAEHLRQQEQLRNSR